MTEIFTKEQTATLMALAWMEGQRWCKMGWSEDKPLHKGSLDYLASKSGKGFYVLDSKNLMRAKQLKEVI